MMMTTMMIMAKWRWLRDARIVTGGCVCVCVGPPCVRAVWFWPSVSSVGPFEGLNGLAATGSSPQDSAGVLINEGDKPAN